MWDMVSSVHSGNFDLKDNEHPGAEDEDLQFLLGTLHNHNKYWQNYLCPESKFANFESNGKIYTYGESTGKRNIKTICEMLHPMFEKKSFLHRLITFDKKLVSQCEKDHGFLLVKPPHALQSPIALVVKQFTVFGSTRMFVSRAINTWWRVK